MVPLVQYVVCLAVTEAIKDLSLRNVSFLFLNFDVSYSYFFIGITARYATRL